MSGETGAGLVTIAKLVEHVADAADMVDMKIQTVKGTLNRKPNESEMAAAAASPASPSAEAQAKQAPPKEDIPLDLPPNIPVEKEEKPQGCGCFGGKRK
jgi:hypothetical protein